MTQPIPLDNGALVTQGPDGLFWACDVEDAVLLPPQGEERTQFVLAHRVDPFAAYVRSGTMAPEGECVTCDKIRAGDTSYLEGPPHRNSSFCQSGNRPHCSCDSCF